MTRSKPKKVRKGRIAACSDAAVVVGPAVDFGRKGVGEEDAKTLRDALLDVDDEDEFFFASVDVAEALGGGDEGGYVAARYAAAERAPLGLFDMTARDRPFPAIGYVAAKNVSSRDAVLFAENEEGEVVAKSWPRGATIELRSGKTTGRRPPRPKGKVPVYLPYSYDSIISYVEDSGTVAAERRTDVDVAVGYLTKVDEKDFPLAFVTQENRFGKTERREVRAWNGKLWANAPAWRPAGERTSLEERERTALRDAAARMRRRAKSKYGTDALAFAEEARLAGKTLSVDPGSAKTDAMRAALESFRRDAETAVVCGGEVWREVDEPRYVVELFFGKPRVLLSLRDVPNDPGRVRTRIAEFPVTTTKEEVVRATRKRYGISDPRDEVDADGSTATAVDPTFVKIQAPEL